ncbi:MAG: zinc-ribbon domain-containing protein [Planctomycetaceae bacterium]|nr:zinc-ribbon domain-containing protein [Planctomycetaceae bacterium]
MPVKVRCPSCDKSLSAPDAARGKAIKCPGCETKIRVPAGDGDSSSSSRKVSTKAPTRKKASPDSSEFLSTVDLSKVIDSGTALCTKCGAEIPDEAMECPKCGVDPTTGQLSVSAKRRIGRKGPDPAQFYSVAWKNAWSFATSNMYTVVRIAVYSFIFFMVAQICAYMVNWSDQLPPKMFWAGFGLVASLVGPGLVWAMTVNVIRATVVKKVDMRDAHIETFQNVALGIKTFLWTFAFMFPFGLTLVMYPLAMIHMAMPVTKKAWLWPVMTPIFFKNLGPALFWLVSAFAVNLVPAAVAAGGAVLVESTLGGILTLFSYEGKSVVYLSVVGGSLFAIAGLFFFLQAFTLLFHTRIIGLIAYYYRDTLGLVTLAFEKQYVHREIKRDLFGNPLKTTGQKVLQALIPIGAVLVLGAIGFYIWYAMFRTPS